MTKVVLAPAHLAILDSIAITNDAIWNSPERSQADRVQWRAFRTVFDGTGLHMTRDKTSYAAGSFLLNLLRSLQAQGRAHEARAINGLLDRAVDATRLIEAAPTFPHQGVTAKTFHPAFPAQMAIRTS